MFSVIFFWYFDVWIVDFLSDRCSRKIRGTYYLHLQENNGKILRNISKYQPDNLESSLRTSSEQIPVKLYVKAYAIPGLRLLILSS
jgi:hypothetical protein